MELLENLKDLIKNSSEYEETRNYYFQNHNCDKNGNNIKVQLDYTLSCDISDKIVRFGQCPYCLKTFYHYDYNSKTF